MNEKLTIKNNSAFYSVLGLAFLLIFSPCKVRNYVQAELGLPITEVANKSKTTISNANCNSFESSEKAIASSSKTNASTKDNILIRVENKFLLVLSSNEQQEKLNTPVLTDNSSFLVVPLYILYQNLKVYL